ncbi:MAG: carbamoyl phosphate synthase large subunit [Myxococcales bacterium]|nr:carbamoyl phosphate synthase large subunit [Myxococcales bacterium]
MPRRQDIRSILLIGSGPIIIGQACEFDYSGTQACKALREEGFRVILVNSNPATIMTDPEFSDATYIEPITPETVARIIEVEKPDALLPTLGGQTALNTAVSLAESGVLEQHGVELLGANLEAINKAEDRALFKAAMQKIGVGLPRSAMVGSEEEMHQARNEVGIPCILRPSFTMGGTGGGTVEREEDYEPMVRRAMELSPVGTVLVEESLVGWKEFELEVIRDPADNVIIVCSIENLDPMGVHTGDSITIAPAMTLSDFEYQAMRNEAIEIIREIGVDTGGSNIQFSVCPQTGRRIVIEMNPRVSRSSALASKATGYPIARIAAKLAVGYTLDELPNDITKVSSAAFEPSIDYVVTKIPRFAFEKFAGADDRLGTAMKSVGEAMGIGGTFRESLHKALRSLETGCSGFDVPEKEVDLDHELRSPGGERLWYLAQAMRQGYSDEQLYELSGIDPWFLAHIRILVEMESAIRQSDLGAEELRVFKREGFADTRIAHLKNWTESQVRSLRYEHGIHPVFRRVDTCAAEFVAGTSYFYSTYSDVCESNPTSRKKMMILGGGPNRIGQGIEFDYCCVQGVFALAEAGYETIMVNCNPETVSTDFDTADRLYFEPLTLENVLEICRVEDPQGVIVQFGGQTPLKLAVPLEQAGVPIIGTSPDAIDRAEDRERANQLMEAVGVKQPPAGLATNLDEALGVVRRLGFPVLVRPSYVLGGRAMEIVFSEDQLARYLREAVKASPEHPVLIDRFLDRAVEVDVDVVYDGERCLVGGVLEHVEQAGVHSGDSACCLPPHTLSDDVVSRIEEQAGALARELGVRGLMNAQFAVQDDEVYVIEVNPRASRTVPFVAKATGVQIARLAARVMAGERLKELDIPEPKVGHFAVKEAVFPFDRFPGADPLLGPEMRSTGEVMGVATTFDSAFARATRGAGVRFRGENGVLLTVRQEDKGEAARVAELLHTAGWEIYATEGTRDVLAQAGIEAVLVHRVGQGALDCIDLIHHNRVSLVVNTPGSVSDAKDSAVIRKEALRAGVAYCTTIAGAIATAGGIAGGEDAFLPVRSMQAYYSA